MHLMNCTLNLKNFPIKHKKLKEELKSIKSENKKLLNNKVKNIFSRASQAEFDDLKEK